MKLVVSKNHLGGQFLYRSDPVNRIDAVFNFYFYTPTRIKGRATNFGGGQYGRELCGVFRTGENLLRKNISEKLDGRHNFVRKTGWATKKEFGGRAIPNYRPSFYRPRRVYKIRPPK